jgi:hypothetical protein
MTKNRIKTSSWFPKSFIPSTICINKRNHAYAAVQVAECVKLVLFFHGFDAVGSSAGSFPSISFVKSSRASIPGHGPRCNQAPVFLVVLDGCEVKELHQDVK